MKLLTSILAAGALFAIAAVAGSAAIGGSSSTPPAFPGATVSYWKCATVASAHRGKSVKAQRCRLVVRRFPAPVNQVSGSDGQQPPDNDCRDYDIGCTDQEACTVWGFNCDLVEQAGATPALKPDGPGAGL
jgi:hypothetical protein